MTDWSQLLPYDESRRQIFRERCRRAARAYAAGAKFTEIAKGLKVSPTRAAQIVRDGKRLQEKSYGRFPQVFSIRELRDWEIDYLKDVLGFMLDGKVRVRRDWLYIQSPSEIRKRKSHPR
ncbi:hypothetical protein [Bradyrhizobium sp.]